MYIYIRYKYVIQIHKQVQIQIKYTKKTQIQIKRGKYITRVSLRNTLVQKSWGARQELQVIIYSASDKQLCKKLDGPNTGSTIQSVEKENLIKLKRCLSNDIENLKQAVEMWIKYLNWQYVKSEYRCWSGVCKFGAFGHNWPISTLLQNSCRIISALLEYHSRQKYKHVCKYKPKSNSNKIMLQKFKVINDNANTDINTITNWN